MKYIRVFSLFFLLFFSSFNVAFAQTNQPTPYQKKQLELSKKYFEILYGYRMTMADEAFYEQLSQGKEAQEFLLALGIMGYATKHSEAQCKKVFTQMANEYKQAEKLKNATDFKLEKDKKLQAEQAAYAKTDVGSIQKNIKYAFEKWNQKGEFEKEIDYAERLKTKSQTAFDEICINQINEKISNYNNRYNYNLKTELSTYNSETEFFIIQFKINGVEWQNKVNIPISKAQSFKNNFSDFRFKVDNYDWCFVENNLCPTLVTLENEDDNSNYNFPLSATNKSEIYFAFNDFGIENQYLNGYTFKYSNAKAVAEQVEKEKQRLDSLELATFNQKLDIIFQDFNKQLLQNPYNINKKILTNFDKIGTDLKTGYDESLTEVRQSKFNKIKDDIEWKFRNLNNNFEKELKSSNPTVYCKIYFSQNPEKKTEADKKYLECKCNYPNREDYDFKFITGNLYNCNCRTMEFNKNGKLFANKEEFDSFFDRGEDVYLLEYEKRTTLKYLNENSQLIQSMNFQKDKNEILTVINNCQNKFYYNQVLDFVIDINKYMNKEWSKNGQFFESKVAFYDAYISDEYKKILKESKKNN
jgi:hypothetical protein